MKKVVFSILGTLAFLLAWGCAQKAEIAAEEEPMVTLEFKADFDNTKTALDDNSVVWEAGDKIVLVAMNYTDPSFADDVTWAAWLNNTGSTKYRANSATSWPVISDPLVAGGANATFTFTVSASDAEKIAAADFYAALVYTPETSAANYSFIEDRKFNNSSTVLASMVSSFYYPFNYSQGSGYYHLAFARNNGGNNLSFKNLHPVLKFTTGNNAAAYAVLRDRLDEDNYIAGNYGCYSRGGEAYSGINPRNKLSSSYTEYSYIEKNIVPGEPTYITLHHYYSFPNGFVIKILNISREEIARFTYDNAFNPVVGHLTTISNFDDRTE